KDFLTITSHELKTPATLIAGYADLILMQERLSAEDAELVELLREGISWLTNIVDDLLEGLRIDAREMQLNRRELHLGEVVASALRWLKPLIEEERSLSIVVGDFSRLSPLHADYDRLREVFVNLIGNAVKFTPDGGEIRIDAHEAEGYCHVFVRDTGIGIPPSALERIFDRFYRLGDPMLHSSSKTAFMGGGIGLGLTICRGVIQAHGGLIWAESEGEGKGTTLRFTLPIMGRSQ
ncbi:MAG: PAS domain-containing sensor histidine kinase, partial [Deltaproteobacteria bacterium]